MRELDTYIAGGGPDVVEIGVVWVGFGDFGSKITDLMHARRSIIFIYSFLHSVLLTIYK